MSLLRPLTLTLAVAILSIVPIARAATISATPSQTFLGVGGSGAWWPNDLFHFPENVRQNVSNLLFSDSGLGLSSYRWNIGSGGVNVSNPTRAIETFYVSRGVYNWSADAQGVYFLREASKRGVPSLTAFVNSAPAQLTSGKASCNGQFVTGTGAAYGTFVADVVSHFRSEGINISYISPMNEPDSSFGPSPCGQEGMQVMPNQRAEVIREVFNALSAKGLQNTVGILADESSSLGNARNEYASWLPQVINQVAALVHHTYDFPSDDSYSSFVANVRSQFPGKATWMSEVCCSLGNADGSGRGWSGGYDPTIKNALLWANMVFQSFNIANEPHYDFWTLLSNQLGCSPLNNPSCATNPNSNGWTDGLIYYDSAYATSRNFQLYVTKHFWVYKHFGNFIKPGSQRRAITGPDATKFTLAVSTAKNYYIIALNPNTGDSSVTLTFPDSVCPTSAFRTSASEDFASVPIAVRSSSNWVLALKATSLTTFVFDRRAC